MIHTYPDWSAPANIKALTTTRIGGISISPFDGNNLAYHVDDKPEHVTANRLALKENLGLPKEPEWLDQIHSTKAVLVEQESDRQADAALTRDSRFVLAIMTADCLPILLCNKQGTEIAAIHAGWKGLVNGVIENTLAKMHSDPNNLLAWIGPAICQQCFEVGEEVRQTYVDNYPFAQASFKTNGKKWQADLAQIAAEILNYLSILTVFKSNICTFERKNEFYSYRREQQTGRMASLIWFNNNQE